MDICSENEFFGDFFSSRLLYKFCPMSDRTLKYYINVTSIYWVRTYVKLSA